MEKLLFVVRSLKGSTIWRVCFYTETKTFENKYWTGQKKGEKVKSKRIWHEKEIRFR
ncbi:hypothetical protein RHMOL_RhmolMtG0001000 (mitochondrion) [Rhododendron molle]|nr:hypothetical protein RHMOL_RhmolMtG0001000 [Rhododendron molle]